MPFLTPGPLPCCPPCLEPFRPSSQQLRLSDHTFPSSGWCSQVGVTFWAP